MGPAETFSKHSRGARQTHRARVWSWVGAAADAPVSVTRVTVWVFGWRAGDGGKGGGDGTGGTAAAASVAAGGVGRLPGDAGRGRPTGLPGHRDPGRRQDDVRAGRRR